VYCRLTLWVKDGARGIIYKNTNNTNYLNCVNYGEKNSKIGKKSSN